MTPFTVNFVAVTPLKPNTWTILTSWKVDWPQNKPLSNWNYPTTGIESCQYQQQIWKQEQKSSFKQFCADITIKMFYQLGKQWRKWLPFTMTNISIFWSLIVLYHTWPLFVYTNLLSEMQKLQKNLSIQGKEGDIFFWKISSENVVGGQSITTRQNKTRSCENMVMS